MPLAPWPRAKVYKGIHTPLVSKDLWEHVQSVLAKRLGRHGKKRRHDFAFTGLLTCGHCGGGMVGELKKQKYIYYHCCGNRGECLELYVKQEVLDAQVGDLLRQLTFDEEVMAWITDALRQSHVDEKQFHADAISRLQTDYCKIQNRIDAMYEDKLDGRVAGEFFDTKAAEWRAEQDRIMRDIERHPAANQNYIEEGIQLLDLARRATDLYEKQDASSRRELLGFILSNSVWADGKLTAEFRQPFDLLALATAEASKESAKEFEEGARFEKWYPRQGSNL